MDRKNLDAIIGELHPRQCMRDVTTYWTFRSTVPGPGLRLASEFLCRRYRESGLEAEIIPYPADDETEWIDGRRNPLVWVPRAGRLSIVKPVEDAGTLCTYADEPLCLVSNSAATPAGGIEAPVVLMYSGTTDEEYENVDVAGKVIFTDDVHFLVQAQAHEYGAVGVISDCVCPPWLRTLHPPVREPEDDPDLTLWGVFDYWKEEAGLWGFSLSPRQGRRLRELIRRSTEPVILRAEVDADLVEGTSEMVSALLPGTDLAHEEVWVLAHSSEPGAEDNASGCCMAVEVARALKALIERGVLPPLRRSIRFLHGVEVDGYLPYLHARRDELHHVVAGLCFDSVGQDFSLGGGLMVLSRTPETGASFVDGLLAYLFRVVAAEPNHRFTADTYATFPWTTGPFLGNDAFIADGVFDIPTPEMSTWPYRFYHSSHDTPDKLSENTLGRSGAIAALYVYLLATAGPREALWLAGLAAQDWKRRIGDALSEEALGWPGQRPATAAADAAGPADPTGPPASLEERAARLRALGHHLGLQARDAVEQVLRLAPGDGALAEAVERTSGALQRFAARESEEAVEWVAGLAGQPVPSLLPATLPETLGPRATQVFRRLRWEMVADDDLSAAGQARLPALRERCSGVERMWPWINGRRTVREIWERVQFGGAAPWDVAIDYLELLAAEGLVE
jgi:hypothetical protein